MMNEWKVSNVEDAEYIGIIEFQSNDGEWHNFAILKTDDRLVFGGACNIGFMESGYMTIDLDCFSIDEELQELVEDLECYYNDGIKYTNRIVCNERM